MYTLTRQIAKELAGVFFISLVLLTLFMLWFGITFNAPEELNGLRLATILPYFIPEAVRNALQAASLFAVCVVYGRMSAHNELIALSSLGISPRITLWPALILGLAASWAGVWMYDVGIAWGSVGIQRTLLDNIESIVCERLERDHHYGTSQIFIRVAGVDGRRLLKPNVSITQSDDVKESEWANISAEECTLNYDADAFTITASFRNGVIETRRGKLTFLGTLERNIPLIDRYPATQSWPPQHPSMHELKARIAFQQAKIDKLSKLVESGVTPIPTVEVADVEIDSASEESPEEQLATEQRRLYWLNSQIYRRWANGFFSLAFVTLGVPVSVLMRSGDQLKSFFLCFMPIVLFNHPLHNFCIKLVGLGIGPVWLPWLGNVILMACGLGLLRYVNRSYAPEAPKLMLSWLRGVLR